MRGVIESFDGARGTLRAKDGQLYAFARSALVRRSKEPTAGARIVFRLKDGTVYRAAAGPDQHKNYWIWDVGFLPLEWLLYIP